MNPTTLRNDRDAIIAIVAEHIVHDDKRLRRAHIEPMQTKPKGIDVIDYNSNWQFAYDINRNVIYIQGVSL